MKFKLVDDRILVKPQEFRQEKKTDTGLILPHVADQPHQTQIAEVLMTGKNVHRDDGLALLTEVCRVGDTIIYPQFAGMKVVLDDDIGEFEAGEYRILKKDEILAVIKDE
jgi:co-chaperonin GroES (HSP10)